MTENSNILIHQISTGFCGKFEDLKDEYKNTTELMKIAKKFIMIIQICQKKQLMI